MSPTPDGQRDRHKLTSLSRLSDPGDDAWLRAYARQTGVSVMKVVGAAVKHYRHLIENQKEPKP